MHFLEHPGLSRLSALLKDLDVGDRLLSGRLELFSTRPAPSKVELEAPDEIELLSRAAPYLEEQPKEVGDLSPPRRKRRRTDAFEEDEEEEEEPSIPSSSDTEETSSRRGRSRASSIASSPASVDADIVPTVRLAQAHRRRRSSSISSTSSFLGTQTPERARRLLVQLVTTLNACFPDYDFSSVGPYAFIHVEDFVSVYTAINYHLSFLAEAVIPGFLQDLWSAIKDAVDLREIAIYSYSNTQGQVEADPYLDDEGCLFSFDYFFVDTKHQKILFFSCMTKQKGVGRREETGYESALSPVPSESSYEKETESPSARRKRSRSVSVSSSDFVDEVKEEEDETQEEEDGDIPRS